jgi:Spy/CpxP family protein refolding chaperone
VAGNATFYLEWGYMDELKKPSSRKGHPMNRIPKQLAITASFLLLSAFPVLSQAQNKAPDSTPGQSQAIHEKHGDHNAMLANLNLTEDQKTQIKQIHEGTRSKIEAVNNDSSLSADQKQAKIHDLRRDTHEQVKKVLTPEQRKQFEENMREHRESKQQQTPPTK